MKIKPKCITPEEMTFGHTSQGYILPCCWCDNILMRDSAVDSLYDESISLKNNTVKNIINSTIWTNFVDKIFSDDPPKVCKHFCGELPDTKETIIIKPV